MWQFFERWPTPEAAANADEEEISALLKTLGLYKRRAKTLKRMSAGFLKGDWKEPKDLYGIGKYANDAWHIFCVGDWKSVEPKDHALTWYHDWLKENYG
jgi:methyl-CpG-binding domain protein 4